MLDLFRAMGWRTLHVRPGRTLNGWSTTVAGDGVGFVDVFAVRGSRIVAAELKVGRGKVTPEQAAWLEALQAAGVESHVWREDDYPAASSRCSDDPGRRTLERGEGWCRALPPTAGDADALRVVAGIAPVRMARRAPLRTCVRIRVAETGEFLPLVGAATR